MALEDNYFHFHFGKGICLKGGSDIKSLFDIPLRAMLMPSGGLSKEGMGVQQANIAWPNKPNIPQMTLWKLPKPYKIVACVGHLVARSCKIRHYETTIGHLFNLRTHFYTYRYQYLCTYVNIYIYIYIYIHGSVSRFSA